MKEAIINRDISWLYFNHRVLQEATDERVPLYERIKFLAIYSSNLDEFFRVRVASLRSFKELKKEDRKELLKVKPKKVLKQIRKIVGEQQAEFGRIFREEIRPALVQEGIFLLRSEQFTKEQQSFTEQYFQECIHDLVAPVFMQPDAEAPFLKNRALYFIVTFAEAEQLPAIVEIPSDQLDRFIILPDESGRFCITFLDDIIRHNLPQLFAEKSVEGAFAIKVSRDAELYIDDEFSGDLVEKIRDSLNERNIGLPTRFLYDSNMPEEVLDFVKTKLNLSKYDLVPGARYHNFNDFFSLPSPDNRPDLHNEPLPPLPHPVLAEAQSIFGVLRREDVMLHFPYQSYAYVPKLIWESVDDPLVEEIRITLYRVAAESEVNKALVEAAKNGKKVIAFVEAKARFDEKSNLYWGEQLKAAGATVLYSFPWVKVHTKLLLITRREEGEKFYYAYLGTGNFNEKTARIYADHALLTTHQKMAREVKQVFDLLERRILIPKTKHLMVSPFSTRDRFEELVDAEIANARAGKEAYMILKMNSLEDSGMMAKMMEASQAGVQIRMIVRGICRLVPGIEGLTENIEIFSIVDRFLEHARVYIFANAGNELMFTASADWMTRNLDRRVEVVMPIKNRAVYQELRQIIELQLADNQKARLITAQQNNPYKPKFPGAKVLRSQLAIYKFLEARVQEVQEL